MSLRSGYKNRDTEEASIDAGTIFFTRKAAQDILYSAPSLLNDLPITRRLVCEV